MRPDDYQRFKPEYWLQNHNPNPVAFTDLAVLQSELELRRRRELHRRNSQKATLSAVSASTAMEISSHSLESLKQNLTNVDTIAAAMTIGVTSGKSHISNDNSQENNFNSLPWEEIIPRRIGGIPVIPHEHNLQPLTSTKASEKSRSKSKEAHKDKHSSLFSSSSAWFNPSHVRQEAGPDVQGMSANVLKHQGHWLLKERDMPILSMPPNIAMLRDPRVGLVPEKPTKANGSTNTIGSDSSGLLETQISRTEPKRSSFGMALKDKFNKNPNMYFPAASASRPESRTENNLSQTESSKDICQGDHGSTKSSSKNKTSSNATSLMANSLTMINQHHNPNELSDTDTLILNMSEGSYEKDSRSSMELDTGDHDSFGSAKGSRSSGNSSLSPHNSMEGSPRMVNTTLSSTVGGTASQFPVQSSSSPGISLMGKKTIRNYTPKESSALLREFEDRRNNSVDWQAKMQRNSMQESSESKTNEQSLERKSSMEKMIDDFHKSLPPPPATSNRAGIAVATAKSKKDSTMTSTSAMTCSSKRQSKNGTMNSQISNWSAASSAASFDYQPGHNNKGGSPCPPKLHSRNLPSVDENDQDNDNDNDNDDSYEDDKFNLPDSEIHVQPDDAPSVCSNLPNNFVHRIEIKSTGIPKQSPTHVVKDNRSSSPQRHQSFIQAHEEICTEEMMPPPPPPPPPIIPIESPTSAAASADIDDEKDDFCNLRKLISEGRIAGLNAPPPTFIPPSPPPAALKESKRGLIDVSASASRRPSSAKTNVPNITKTSKTSQSAERQPSRKNREAPKPPIQMTSNVSTPNSEIKFVSSRLKRESIDDLAQSNDKKRNDVKRSSSNHGTRPSGSK